MSQHRVQIDRGFSVETAQEDRFQSRDSSGKVRVQSLGLSLTRRSLLEFALSFGRLRRRGVLVLKTKRFLTIPHIVAVSALHASQGAYPFGSAPSTVGIDVVKYIRSDRSPKVYA